MKKKVTTNPRLQRRALEQIANDIEERRRQMTDLVDALGRHRDSADRRISAMCNLLPDRADEQSATGVGANVATKRSDTDITASSVSRPGSASVSNSGNISTSRDSPRRGLHRDATVVDDIRQTAAAAAAAAVATISTDRCAGDAMMGLVTGGRKLLERRRSRQQPGTASCSNINTKRIVTARNVGGGSGGIASGDAATSSSQLATAAVKRQAEGNICDDVETRKAAGHRTVNINTQLAERTVDSRKCVLIDKRRRDADEKVGKSRNSGMPKERNNNYNDGSISSRESQEDDDDEDEEDDGSDDDSSDDDDDEESRRNSSRRMKSTRRDHTMETKRNRTAVNAHPPQLSKKSTVNGVTSETASGPSLNQVPTADVSATVTDRGIVKRRIQAPVLSSMAITTSKQSTVLASSPDGAGSGSGDKRSPAVQQSPLGVANLAALLASTLGTSSSCAVGNGGPMAGSLPPGDYLVGKPKPTIARQPMTTSRVELSLKLPLD
jgi:hypothetical protein